MSAGRPWHEERLLHEDREARERATDPRRSILLQAPAGSGKTAVLTQRFLRLLASVEEPGAILAVTFTRKAAAEMRARVIRALRGDVGPGEPCASELAELAQAARRHARERGWGVEQDPGALRIQTIDSFTYWLASQLPIAARAGGALTVTETPQELYRRAARRTLLAAEDDAALGADGELLFERLDNQWWLLERLLADMLEKRAHWLRYVLESRSGALCERVNASLESIVREELARLSESLPRALRLQMEGLPGIGPLGADPACLPAWKQLAARTLTGGHWRVRLIERLLGPEYADRATRETLRQCIEGLGRIEGFAERLWSIAALPGAALSEADKAAIAALARLLERAALELHAEFAESGRVDYAYVTGAARAALAEAGLPTELALRTGVKLEHILVDEFQDTSLAQFQLLEALTAAWEEGDGRTLFVVGDPMQSIYRFRDAEVGLFLRARDRGIGNVSLVPLRLSRNFRATPALVAWCNAVFARVLPRADDLRAGAIAFSASTASRPADGEGPATQLWLFPDDPAGEATAMAARIVELRRRNSGASIAVLVAAHANAVPVVAALRAAGVDIHGVDLVPLAERAIVRDLVQLARALYDLGDRTAWLAVLRAPWCGANLGALTVFSGLDERALLWEALNDAPRFERCPALEQPRLVRVREVLARALERRGAGPVADWLETTWVQLGAPDAYPPQDLNDARSFFHALAERCAAGEWRDPEDFDALLRDLFSDTRAEGANPVQIMTIHRAKGLEFDHVLIPALDRAAGLPERSLLRWIDLPRESGPSDLLLSPVPAVGELEAGELSSFLGRLLATRTAHERTRLMYVAATRARESLYLSGAPKARADGRIEPEPRTLLGCLWPALGADFRVAPPPAASGDPPAPDRVAEPVALRRLSGAWVPAELPPAAPLPHLPLGRASLDPREFSWVGERQRHIGTVVHALFAQLAESHPLPAGEALTEWRDRAARLLRREGVPAGELAEASGIVITAVARTLSDARGRWILGGQHPEAASELALTGLADGRLRAVVIDRSFVDESGTRWVIDYKTSRHEGGGLEDFLAEELERYRGQLSTYIALARQLGPQPVRAALYFPLLSAFRELVESAE